jgi:hypothetical protein
MSGKITPRVFSAIFAEVKDRFWIILVLVFIKGFIAKDVELLMFLDIFQIT